VPLDGGVICNDQAFATADAADAGDQAGARHIVVIHAICGERRQLEEGGAGIEKRVDAVANEQLAARATPRPDPGSAERCLEIPRSGHESSTEARS
jgi:hypothetical protein